MTKISIGILAWNEEEGIARSLRSLFRQNLLASTPDWVEALEVVVVPNGCRDRTEHRAEEALRTLTSQHADGRVQARVVSLARPGKSNAWNEYVHRLARPDADYLLLMDADVQLSGPDVLGRLVEALERDPVALVAGANPIKDLAGAGQKGILARLSLSASSLRAVGTAGLCGMLYCARGEALRRVYLPPDLLVEDGFLRAMIATNAFQHGDRAERVIRVDDAQLIFEAEKTLRGLFRHERRICTGSLVNFMLFRELSHRAGLDEDVSEYIRRRNQEDPTWLARFVNEQAAGRLWLVPSDWLVRRFIRAQKAKQIMRRLPFLIPASIFDLLVAVLANVELKRGRLAW